MKSIRDFIASKIRRAEVSDRIRLVEVAEPHPSLGAPEGTIESAAGSATFYESGFTIGDEALPYDRLARIRMDPDGAVDVTDDGGRTLRIRATEAGGRVLFDTLRWIGRARLGRKLD